MILRDRQPTDWYKAYGTTIMRKVKNTVNYLPNNFPYRHSVTGPGTHTCAHIRVLA